MTDEQLRADIAVPFNLPTNSPMFKEIVEELIAKRAELKLAYDNLTATQTRCNELLEENREHKRHIQAIRIAWANLIGSDGKMP